MQDYKLPCRAQDYFRPRNVLRWYLLWAAWRAVTWLEFRLLDAFQASLALRGWLQRAILRALP